MKIDHYYHLEGTEGRSNKVMREIILRGTSNKYQHANNSHNFCASITKLMDIWINNS